MSDRRVGTDDMQDWLIEQTMDKDGHMYREETTTVTYMAQCGVDMDAVYINVMTRAMATQASMPPRTREDIAYTPRSSSIVK